MEYIFDNVRPIYVQLVEKIRIEIVSGKLMPGEKLPSVRELAITAKVNPNTLQKALGELEAEGLIYTERTNGKYVTENEELINEIRNELAIEKAKQYLRDMKNIGIDNLEARKYLENIGGNK